MLRSHLALMLTRIVRTVFHLVRVHFLVVELYHISVMMIEPENGV